jgi:hypothetical protein
MKIIPTKKSFGSKFVDGLYGAGAGAVNGILTQITGSPFLGSIIGSTIVGALVTRDNVGTIIAVNGYMDAVESLLLLGR